MSIDEMIESAESGEMLGLCRDCGNTQPAEPDARNYTCEECGHNTVYGMEEFIMMFGG